MLCAEISIGSASIFWTSFLRAHAWPGVPWQIEGPSWPQLKWFYASSLCGNEILVLYRVKDSFHCNSPFDGSSYLGIEWRDHEPQEECGPGYQERPGPSETNHRWDTQRCGPWPFPLSSISKTWIPKLQNSDLDGLRCWLLHENFKQRFWFPIRSLMCYHGLNLLHANHMFYHLTIVSAFGPCLLVQLLFPVRPSWIIFKNCSSQPLGICGPPRQKLESLRSACNQPHATQKHTIKLLEI